MYLYSAFGLGIHSDLHLPELVTLAEAKPDITIRLGRIDSFPPETIMHDGIFRYFITSGEAFFLWEDIALFRVRNGSEIVIETLPSADKQMIRILLLGAVFATLLYQRKLLVLHASAISIGGNAVAFIGRKGQGKSTVAAALYARGHELIADDTVALQINSSINPMVLPGFPQIKLWPDSVTSSLGEDPEMLPRVAAKYEKRARYASDRFTSNSVPLKRIYILSEGSSLELKPLYPQEAVLQLIGNSHIARFGKHALSGAEAALNLRQCTKLANDVSIYRLTRPDSLPLLSIIAQLVEEQFLLDTHADDCTDNLVCV